MGFNKHSEIGWVLREYNDLINKAHKLGLKLPDIIYTDGKTKGKISKDSGVDPHKSVEKPDIFVKKVDTSCIGAGFDEDTGENESHTSQRKPSLNERPKFVEKGKANDIPEFLEGFKHHRRR